VSRENIEFSAQGTTLRGWFYPAASADAAACVVVQHGFSGTKEQYLDNYAECFQAAGLAVLVYDHPGFGASDPIPGTPRLEIDPWQQVRCIQDAITYAQGRPDVDGERIGLWGSSYGGAHALVVAASDRRVKAVVSQVPPVSGSASFREFIRIDQWAMMDAAFAGDRLARAAGAEPGMLPVVTNEPMAPAALPMIEAYEWCIGSQDVAPTWQNAVTIRSMEFLRGYEPGRWLPLISPTPLLMVIAPMDRVADGQLALKAYETALEPKKLVMVPGGHFDNYTGEGFEATSAPARDWFVEHLLKSGT
jgi:fermentation-respiration switch protein FrsA (DUF1100 family)